MTDQPTAPTLLTTDNLDAVERDIREAIHTSDVLLEQKAFAFLDSILQEVADARGARRNIEKHLDVAASKKESLEWLARQLCVQHGDLDAKLDAAAKELAALRAEQPRRVHARGAFSVYVSAEPQGVVVERAFAVLAGAMDRVLEVFGRSYVRFFSRNSPAAACASRVDDLLAHAASMATAHVDPELIAELALLHGFVASGAAPGRTRVEAHEPVVNFDAQGLDPKKLAGEIAKSVAGAVGNLSR